jgi:hypothetical protein
MAKGAKTVSNRLKIKLINHGIEVAFLKSELGPVIGFDLVKEKIHWAH